MLSICVCRLRNYTRSWWRDIYRILSFVRSLACLSVRSFVGCPSYSWFYSATHPDLYKARSPKRTIIIRFVARRGYGGRHP